MSDPTKMSEADYRAWKEARRVRADLIVGGLLLARSERPRRYAVALWLLGQFVTPREVQEFYEGKRL